VIVQNLNTDSNVKMRPIWAAALYHALNQCTPSQAGQRRVGLPYCIQTMNALPERAVLLNRFYKPLGMRDGWFAYEEHPEAHIHIELFRLLEPTESIFYFFDDYNPPWDSPKSLHEYRAQIIDLVSPWIQAREWKS
jgi:hypothetical protein